MTHPEDITIDNYFDLAEEERLEFYFDDRELFHPDGWAKTDKRGWIKWWDTKLYNKYRLLLEEGEQYANYRRKGVGFMG